jgi:hypothetical protein
MRVKKEELKVKPEMKIAKEFLDLRTAEKQPILEMLEENMRIRELPIEMHVRPKFYKALKFR